MSWDTELTHKNLKFSLYSGHFWGNTPGEVVGFFIGDESTREAIKNRDQRIFEILDLMLTAEGRDICNAHWAGDGIWWEQIADQDNAEEVYTSFEDNPYATSAQKEWARFYLKQREMGRQKLAEMEAKKALTKKRRQEFQSQRDRLFLALIERDGYICAEPDCGCYSDLTIDHVIPITRGGSDELDNLRLLCRSCNSRKGNR